MRRCSLFRLGAIGLVALGAREARAQAWTPPKGEMGVTLGYSRSFADEHIDSHGNVLTIPAGPAAGQGWGDMTWNDADLALGYGITDRLAARLAVPFVVSQYVGAFPHPPLFPGHQDQDNGNWYGTFGDFAMEMRFRATKGALVVTPLVGFSIPTGYEYYSHSAAGRGLKEARIGVNLGRLLDPVIPHSFIQVRYTFSIPEKVLGISHDRSNTFFDAGYFVTPSLTLSVIGDWQVTHGGWRNPEDVPLPPDPNFLYHDQLQRSNYLRLGGSLTYALTKSIDIAASYYASAYVRSELNMSGFALYFTYGFSPSQLVRKMGHKQPKEPSGTPPTS